SAWLTELMGIHALFGAFLFGAILPRQGGLARALVEKLEDLVIIALVPLFFAYSGVRTQVGLLDSAHDWAVCGLILLVATLGKAGGGALAARLAGLSWREAGALGVLMNTRGLMGIIVLNIGLDLGVISTALFSMMIIMALVTTVLATPLLQWIYPAEALARDLVEGLEPPARHPERRVLVCVSHAAAAPGLLEVASRLAHDGAGLYALHLVATDERSVHLDEEATPGPLLAAIASADQLGVAVKPLSFVSPDPADDICRVAAVQRADLVLLGCHRPLIGHNALGGAVAAVLRQTPSTAAVLIDRGLGPPTSALVPFRGSADDRAALRLAARIAGGAVTVLAEGAGPSAQLLAELGTRVAVEEVDSLASAVTARADGFPIVPVGVEPDWTVVREIPTSLLLVRGPAGARDS